MNVKSIDFKETKYTPYEKNIVFSSLITWEAFADTLAENLKRNFGLTSGDIEKDFDKKLSDIMLIGNLNEKYHDKSKYLILSIIRNNDDRIDIYKDIYLVMRAEDSDLFKEVKSAIEKMPDYTVTD